MLLPSTDIFHDIVVEVDMNVVIIEFNSFDVHETVLSINILSIPIIGFHKSKLANWVKKKKKKQYHGTNKTISTAPWLGKEQINETLLSCFMVWMS